MAVRSLLIAALIFVIFSNAFGASINPIGARKRFTTTTLPPSTTTMTTTAGLQEVEKDDEPQIEMIRQCTCAESDECINKAWSKISSCQESCKAKLEFFGDDTDAGLKCFDNDKNGGTLINNCFKTIKGYCAKTSADSPQYIEKPTYEPKPDNKLKFKEHEIVEAFKAFHMCAAGECMKDIIVQCFEEKQCAVSLGDQQDIGKIGDFCHTLKGSIYTTSVKALPCLMPGLKRRGATKRQQQ
jgi:hypothetical protein